jgi:hypothetical protein
MRGPIEASGHFGEKQEVNGNRWMNSPSSARRVQLVDARSPGRPIVAATIHRGFPASFLEDLERIWSPKRRQQQAEHAHWDWRQKAGSVESGEHLLVVVESEGRPDSGPEGVMAVRRQPVPARLAGRSAVVYVDYLESAPWNLREFVQPRYLGVGTVLMADAVRLSHEQGLGGAVGLHSLPQAEPFYGRRCQMTRLGPDPAYYDLVYFEYTGEQARRWIASLGESL